jgi:hypothetical protein
MPSGLQMSYFHHQLEIDQVCHFYFYFDNVVSSISALSSLTVVGGCFFRWLFVAWVCLVG